jgi:mono/diheme cytochrome c family protein
MNANRSILLLAPLALCFVGGARAQSSPPQEKKAVAIKTVTAQNTMTLEGADLYKEYCAVCHGTAGKGDGPAAAALKNRPADLTLLNQKNGGKFPALAVKNYIAGQDTVAAHGTRTMPIWGGIFSQMSSNKDLVQLRIANLMKYLEQMQK